MLDELSYPEEPEKVGSGEQAASGPGSLSLELIESSRLRLKSVDLIQEFLLLSSKSRDALLPRVFVNTLGSLDQLQSSQFTGAIELGIEGEYTTAEGARRIYRTALVGAEKHAAAATMTERHDPLSYPELHESLRFIVEIDLLGCHPAYQFVG